MKIVSKIIINGELANKANNAANRNKRINKINFFHSSSNFQRNIEKYRNIQNTYRYFALPMRIDNIDMMLICQHHYCRVMWT